MFKYKLTSCEDKEIMLCGAPQIIPVMTEYVLESSIPLTAADVAKGLAEKTGIKWECADGTISTICSPSNYTEPKDQTSLWCQGYIVEVMSDKNESEYIVKVVEELPMADNLYKIFGKKFKEQYKFDLSLENTFYTVSKKDCEPIVTTLYKVGDTIMSKLSGSTSLNGRVVGFEISTNRVVCVSDKISNYNDDRTRYVYSISQVSLYDPDAIKFKKGTYYTINNDRCLCVTETAQTVAFTKNDVIVFTNIPRNTTYTELYNLYLMNVSK